MAAKPGPRKKPGNTRRDKTGDKDRRIKELQGRITALEDELRLKGDAGGSPGVVSLQRAEEALWEKESQFRQLSESLPQLVWTCRAEGPCDYLSPQWVSYTGVPEDMQLGYGWLDQVHPDDRERVSREWASTAARGEVFDIEFRIRRYDGAYRWFKTRAIPLKDMAGTLVKWYGSNTDIDDIKQAEETMRASRSMLELVMGSVPQGIFWKDRGSTYLGCNDVFARAVGLESSGDVAGKTDYDMPWSRDQAEWFLEYDRRIMDDDRPEYHIIEQMTEADGRLAWVETNKVPLHDAEGNVIGILGTYEDITERMKVEKERETTVEFLNLVNMARSTRELIVKSASFFQQRSGCEAVGIRLREGDDYPYYEARGFRPEFIRKENRLCNRDAQGRVLRDKAGFPVLDCMCGNVITGRFDPAKPFFTERGSFWTNSTTELLATTTEKDRMAKTRNVCNTEGYESFALIALRVGEEKLGVLQLNDRRKNYFTLEQIQMWERLADYLAVALAKFQAEDALKESEERFRNLADNIPNLSWMADSDGNFYWYNKQWYDYTGTTQEEMRGWGWQKVHHPDYIEPVTEEWQSKLKLGQPFEKIFPLRGKDGNYRWFLTRAIPIKDADGKVVRWLGTNTDITDRMKAEKALENEKMEAELYLDLMGHDISNMHQIAIAELELAREIMDEGGRIDKDARELVDTPLATLERSARLIDNVRKLQKLRAGVYGMDRVDLGKLVAEAIDTSRDYPDGQASIHYEPVENYLVEANPLLRDVFTNLIINAMKHSKGPTQINITVDKSDDGGKSYYRVMVEDNGPGIQDGRKTEIFHRFKRGQTTARGTGLGLYIVKTLVESFHGRVKVEDRIKGDCTRGSRFIVELPVLEEHGE